MDSISDTLWDVVICGTGLPQSLLALSLSRSGKKVLHIDPNDYYGGTEAALSLQEAESWVASIAAHAIPTPPATGIATATDKDIRTKPIFSAAEKNQQPPPQEKDEDEKEKHTPGLSSRAYSLALAPQIIHAKSELLRQLVSSHAYRQVEFLAVGAFFIFKPPAAAIATATVAANGANEREEKTPEQRLQPSLVRIPSTREDVFLATTIPARGKRMLMKFLKFIVDYESASHAEIWAPYADKPLSDFLRAEFSLDAELQSYVTTLTLSLDGGGPSTARGLAAIHRHLSSFGLFGPGFAAVYPKWGGLSEIAQVACRAGAVGGGVYMLGTGVTALRTTATAAAAGESRDGQEVQLDLDNGLTVRSRLFARGGDQATEGTERISRLVAVVNSPLSQLFEPLIEGAPKPAVAVIAFPAGSIIAARIDETPSEHPIYMFAHSSDTGECPPGQSVLYLTMMSRPNSKALLEQALESFLDVMGDQGFGKVAPHDLYRLYYEQAQHSTGSTSTSPAGPVLNLSGLSLSLAFDDTDLGPVRQAWNSVMAGEADDEAGYMVFTDREGAAEDEDDRHDVYGA